MENSKAKLKKAYTNVLYLLVLLTVIKKGLVNSVAAVVRPEGKIWKYLIIASEAGGLIHVIFAECSSPKVPKVTNQGLKLDSSSNYKS